MARQGGRRGRWVIEEAGGAFAPSRWRCWSWRRCSGLSGPEVLFRERGDHVSVHVPSPQWLPQASEPDSACSDP